jgi:hypothetical protein
LHVAGSTQLLHPLLHCHLEVSRLPWLHYGVYMLQLLQQESLHGAYLQGQCLPTT